MLALLFSLSLISQAQDYVEQPEGCLHKKTFPCAVRALKSPTTLSSGSQKFQLEKASSLVILEKSTIKLLQGRAWIQESNALTVSQGLWRVAVDGDVWIERPSADQLVVKNLNGQIHAQNSNTRVTQPVPVGFENWYGALNSKGEAEQGVIRPIDRMAFFVTWNQTVQLEKSERADLLKSYAELWKGSVEVSAQLYKEVSQQRSIASEQKRSEEQRRRALLQKQEAEVRAMFRQRFYYPELSP